MENSTKEVNPLRLWSWQEPGFLLTEGTVDHQRSKYYKTAGVPKSYKELSKQLIKRFKLELERADQFVWCYTRQDEHIKLPSSASVEWKLEVPKQHVLAFICSVVWHCIVWCNGGERGLVGTPPQKLGLLWGSIAGQHGFNSDDFNKEFYRFWYAKTDEELWDALFLDKVDGDCDCTHVLLRHPIEKSWVISVQEP